MQLAPFKLKFFLTIIISIFIFPQYLLSSQFGLNMGETKEDISNKGVSLKDDGNYWYTTEELPKGNSKLTKYDLLITPKSGLCRIISHTDILYSNSFGDQLINEFEFFEKALTKKYGTNKKYDFVKRNSIWNDSQYWMMGLLKEERYLEAYWTNDVGSNLPQKNIKNISVRTFATSTEEGYISLNYEFLNIDACSIEYKESQTDNI